MGLQFIEKGSIILTPKNVELLRKTYSSVGMAVGEIENANGASKESPFRDGLYVDAEKKMKTAEKFFDVLMRNINQGVQKGS